MRQLNESLEYGDLTRLINPELHVDEFKSKMGDDPDIITLSFKITGKDPAADLMDFIEKGYEWVLDADVSAGEKEDGDYIVFVETERRTTAPANIIAMLEDLMNLTEQTLDEWHFKYYHDRTEHPLTVDELTRIVPLSPHIYRKKMGIDEIDDLKAAAGLKIDTEAPKNDFTESIRIAAGIR